MENRSPKRDNKLLDIFGLTLRPLLLIEEEPTLFEHDFSDVDERMLADKLAEVDYNIDEVS